MGSYNIDAIQEINFDSYDCLPSEAVDWLNYLRSLYLHFICNPDPSISESTWEKIEETERTICRCFCYTGLPYSRSAKQAHTDLRQAFIHSPEIPPLPPID